MSINDFTQIIDWNDMQLYEKVEKSQQIEWRGIHTYIVKGKETTVRAWIDEFTNQYPSSGYGTTFQLTDVNRTIVTYVGTRSTSCD